MILRNFYACNTCSKEYFIRYGTSDQFPQKSSFFCKKCGEKLILGYDKDKKIVTENLKKIDENETLEIINLHPEIIIDSEKASDRNYFPTIEFLIKQARKGNESLDELRNSQQNIIIYNNLWDKIEKNLRFLSEERYSLIDKKYGSEKSVINKRISKQIMLIAQHFLSGKWKKILDDAILELKKARTKPNFIEFKNYLQGEFKETIQSIYYVMDEYSKLRTEMLVTLHSQKCGHDLDGISSIIDWDKIEMMYGNLYEKYGKLLSFVTGINNLIERSDFKKFSSPDFNFEKYLASDKANRCNNFITNPELYGFSEFYDANIRNGTHHKNAKINKEEQEIILGIGKGDVRERHLSFVEYISYCNEIYARILILINLYFRIIF